MLSDMFYDSFRVEKQRVKGGFDSRIEGLRSLYRELT